jgi:hypothetical protein
VCFQTQVCDTLLSGMLYVEGRGVQNILKSRLADPGGLSQTIF